MVAAATLAVAAVFQPARRRIQAEGWRRSGPMATEQTRTGARDALGQPAGNNPTGDVGLAHSNSRR